MALRFTSVCRLQFWLVRRLRDPDVHGNAVPHAFRHDAELLEQRLAPIELGGIAVGDLGDQLDIDPLKRNFPLVRARCVPRSS